MRRLLVVVCVASALALVAPASGQTTAGPGCGLSGFPTLGNIHRFVGEAVTYDLTNNDTRYFDAFIEWGDGPTIGSFPGLYPGDEFLFSHAYSAPGSYSPVMYIHVADPSVGLCSTSFTLGTVRVRGHARG